MINKGISGERTSGGTRRDLNFSIKSCFLVKLNFLLPRGFLVSNRVTMRASQMSIECIQIKYDGHRIILILIIDTYLRYILRHREKIGEIKVTFGFFLCFSDLEIFDKSARKD